MIKYIYHSISEKIEINKNSDDILIINNEEEFSNFLENSYLIDKIVLKEEKETMFFYKNLTKEDKKYFNIDSYFDCINIAYQYYNLMETILSNNISFEDIKESDEALNTVIRIHNNMLKTSNETSMMPRYMKYMNVRLNKRFLEKISKIIIINKFYTTKKEKELLENLGKEIEYHLYTKKGDYNEELNILEDISYENISNKVEVYSFNTINDEHIFLTQYLSNNMSENIEIYDLLNNRELYRYLNQNLINCNIKETFDSTISYKIINLTYNIVKNKSLIYPIYEAFLDSDFTSFYNISLEKIETVKKGMKNSLKYIGLDLIEDILSITLDELVTRLSEIYIEDSAILLEAYTEILSLKDFKFYDIIDRIEDEYKLLLKYLDAKKLNRKLESKLFEISYINGNESENTIILNLQEDLIKSNGYFILNSKQRQKLNIIDESRLKYVKYYPYIRKIYLSKNIKLLHLYNLEENINIFSIFKNFLYKNKIEVQNIEYSMTDKLNFINSVYEINEYNKNSKFLTDKDYIKINKNYFEKVHLNGYNFRNFIENDLDFYLKSLMDENGISDISLEEKSIGANVIGNIVHKIFEYAIKENTTNNLEEIKNKVLEEYRPYILEKYFEVYNKMLFTDVLKEIKEYIEEQKSNGYELESEKKLELELNNININIRIDMILNKENTLSIVDIKTGKPSKASKKLNSVDYQLALYELSNKLDKKTVDKIYAYYPYEKRYIYTKLKVNEEILLERYKKLNNLDKLYVIDESSIYGMNDIVRYDDYEKKDS